MSEADKLAVEAFRRDVVEPSRTQLVIVDFWAEWCGPCKQLTPIIEKVCADYAAKGVKLVKVNVDENGFIASQFRVQSIPTVYAVFQGQPVADLTQARTEGALKQYLDQLLSQLPIESEEKSQAQEIAPLIAMPPSRRMLFNVNFPAIEPDAVKGIRVVRQGFHDVDRTKIIEGTDPRGYRYYWFSLGSSDAVPEGSDLAAIAQDYVTVTPLHYDLTQDSAMAATAAAFGQ